MHELSIALSLLDLAAEESERLGEGRAGSRALHVKLGPLSGVVKQALLSAYGLAREQGPFSDVDLMIEETPLLAHCPACNATRAVVSEQELLCRECGTPTAEVVSGRELDLVALEFQ